MRATTAAAANSGRHKRQRGRPQMDLFDSVRSEASGAPLWPELPERARSALTELMTRLILAHAAMTAPLRLALCWSHVRRCFYELAQSGPAPIVSKALQRIAGLYRVEAAIRGHEADARRGARQEKCRPILEAM